MRDSIVTFVGNCHNNVEYHLPTMKVNWTEVRAVEGSHES